MGTVHTTYRRNCKEIKLTKDIAIKDPRATVLSRSILHAIALNWLVVKGVLTKSSVRPLKQSKGTLRRSFSIVHVKTTYRSNCKGMEILLHIKYIAVKAPRWPYRVRHLFIGDEGWYIVLLMKNSAEHILICNSTLTRNFRTTVVDTYCNGKYEKFLSLV